MLMSMPTTGTLEIVFERGFTTAPGREFKLKLVRLGHTGEGASLREALDHLASTLYADWSRLEKIATEDLSPAALERRDDLRKVLGSR